VLTRTDYEPLELLIVDNDSADPETHRLFARLAEDARVRVIRHPGKYNYSAMNNRGVQEARGNIVVLMNNDVDVISSPWLEEMVSQALRPEIGAVGAKLLYRDGRVQHAGVCLGVGGIASHFHHLVDRADVGSFGRAALTSAVSAVTGACLAVRKSVYEEVGGLDEVNLAVAYNDVDLCLKIREKGYRNVWTPYAELYQREFASTGSAAASENGERARKEADYLCRTWGSKLHADAYYNPNCSVTMANFDPGFPPRRQKPWLDFMDTALQRNADAAVSGLNPLVHYLVVGAERGYDPSPLFDTDWYVANYPDVTESGLNPLAHYLLRGAEKGYDPSPLFDTDWYLDRNPDVARSGINPLAHFLASGAIEGRDPSPLFDTDWYLDRNPDVQRAGMNPLAHFITSGAAEGRDPSLFFDTDWYATAYPETAESGYNPLVHYLLIGAAKGYDPSALFDTDWYVERYEDVSESGLNPLAHYLLVGAARGYDPSPLFDTDWYLAENPDILNEGISPLAHFISSGAAEGRQPRPVDRLSAECHVLDIPYEIWRSPPSLVGRDVCLFVTYSPNGHIYDHVLTYLAALKAEGLAVVLVVATDGLDKPLTTVLDRIDGILVRINHGWDFAAWAAGLAVFPDLWSANSLILANDSLYGPIGAERLKWVIDAIRSGTHDIIALTDSYQTRYHLMSYFTGLTSGGLAAPAVREFWNAVRSFRDGREKVINAYELTSAERYRASGISFRVLFPTVNDRPEPINPTLVSWRELIDRGFPFLKVQLLRDKLSQCDPSGWRDYLPDNLTLKKQIEEHLEVATAKRAELESYRPIPAPRRRYDYNFDLKTYYGATPSCRPTEATDLALEVPFRFVPADLSGLAPVAVIAHIFYPEMADDLLSGIMNIPVRADVFISTDSVSKRSSIRKAFKKYRNGTVEVRVLPNVGRDIAPMLVGFGDIFGRYAIFCHIHSKRSPHDGRFAPWRDFLLGNLLGSPAIVRSILGLFAASDVGIVFSQHFPPVRSLLNFGYDYEMMHSLLARAGIALSKDMVLEFPSGSFFWGRTSAIRPLLDHGFTWASFPPEEHQVDGTLAHAIERSILYLAEGTGHRWVKVAQAGNVRADTLVPVHEPGAIDESVSRVHRPLLGNRLRPLESQRLIEEVRPIGVKRDPNSRPRLTLIVPDLQPKYMFGGMATALQLFNDIERKLGDAFDYRIVSVAPEQFTRVDLASMIGFPGYRRLSLGAIGDDLPRTIVDASDATSGELSVRKNEIFIATAWWTAVNAAVFRQGQALYHGRALPLVYLIQDHEPDFYGWSSQYALAQETYAHAQETIAIVNSEELANYLNARYALKEAYVLRFAINPSIEKTLKLQPRERIILVYGRMGARRNAFGVLCAGIAQWQQAEPTIAAEWRIISAGEDFNPRSVRQVKNLEVAGKLSLKNYAEMLGKASVGISLMLSPHPSYPPLEMASAGMRVITNSFEGKDLSLRSPNIVSLPDVTPDAIAAALSAAVPEAERDIGKVTGRGGINELPCTLPIYDAARFAGRLKEIVGLAKPVGAVRRRNARKSNGQDVPLSPVATAPVEDAPTALQPQSRAGGQRAAMSRRSVRHRSVGC
jgi:lipopolysaccharide biosynthesis protein/GT2 family glycosyltransferase